MADGKGQRLRGYRLTDEGLATLQAAIASEFAALNLEGRLTRATAAGILGISTKSANKVLGQKGNDLALLEQCFAALRLDWSVAYCEPCAAATVKDHVLQSHAKSADPIDIGGPPSPRRAPRVAILVAAALVLCVVGAGVQANRDLDGPRKRMYQAIDKASVAYNTGNYAQARNHIDLAIRVAKSEWDGNGLVQARGLEGQICAAEGDLTGAVRCYKEALSTSVPFQKPKARACLLESLGVAEARLGQTAEAEAHLQESLEWHRKTNDKGGEAMAARGLGSIAALRGDVALGRQWYGVARRALAGRIEPAMLTDLRALDALLMAKDGKPEVALRELQTCLSYWQARGHPRWQATILLQIASVHQGSGDASQAAAAIARAKGLYQQVGDKRGVAECDGRLTHRQPGSQVVSVEDYF